MQKKLIAIVIGLLMLLLGTVISLNRGSQVHHEQVKNEKDQVIEGIVEAEFVSWDNFAMSGDEKCQIALVGNFDDENNVHVNVSSKKGDVSFDIGNAYDFSIHKSTIGENTSLFFFTGIVKEGKNITHVIKCEDDRFELKGVFYHFIDRFYTDGASIYFYSNDSSGEEALGIKLKYAYNLSDRTSAEVTDQGVLKILQAYEERY